MNLTLTALLAAALPAAPPNLDFSAGKLTHWQGEGFALTKQGASSADRDGKGRKALLHRTFTLPADAEVVRFRAAAVRPAGARPGGALEVYLEAAGREYAPRQVRQGEKWEAAPALLAAEKGEPREYSWSVAKYAGRRVRIALVDSDDRPGCHVVAGGFAIGVRGAAAAARFAADMRKLQVKHNLGRMLRYDSRHFVALSNADPEDARYRLANCEVMYAAFFRHFRKKGFAVREPGEKLMVAIFRTQEGLEAYVGQRVSVAVTGLYHLKTNRLVVYDYGRNRGFAQAERRLEAEAKLGATDLERERRIVRTGRLLHDHKGDTNISTVMHEAAHQLSFNSGLMNRHGDVPLWLAEGLAVYCEATVKGSWQGIGEPNPARAAALARAAPMALRALVENDDWARKAKTVDGVLLGYSQSWALFRLLMEERPRQLRAYMKLARERRTPDHRLADFGEAFGDLRKLERRYREYLREVAEREGGK
jgi:hypothetical protein